jgi:hypothetical protein
MSPPQRWRCQRGASAITRPGINAIIAHFRPQVLRLLIEAAWHHRKPGPTMRARWDMTQSPTRRRGRESFSLITRATAPCSGSLPDRGPTRRAAVVVGQALGLLLRVRDS